MNELIKVRNTSYDRYEELLMLKDSLKKEAFILQSDYIAEFGDLILEVFEKKIECIKKKKIIEYAQIALNHGKSIDPKELQEFLQKEMAGFQAQLDDLLRDTKNAKERETITEYDLLKIKRIYHKLVKLIHPDINPKTGENEILSDLWQRVQLAYRCNDLKAMEELEVLVSSVLEELGVGAMEIEIPNIEEKIAELEEEIKQIRETDPYMYKFLLVDPDAVELKKQSLKEELHEYELYSSQLDEILEGLLSSGVNITWEMN